MKKKNLTARRYLITNTVVSLLDFKPKKSSSLKKNKSEMVSFFSRGFFSNCKSKTGSRDFKSFNIKLVLRYFGVWNCWGDNHVFFSQFLNVYF